MKTVVRKKSHIFNGDNLILSIYVPFNRQLIVKFTYGERLAILLLELQRYQWEYHVPHNLPHTTDQCVTHYLSDDLWL